MNDNRLTSLLMENTLQDFKKNNISKEDRAYIVKELIKRRKCSVRQLAKELDISHSTLHDWVSQRQDNKGKNIHISFDTFYRKINSLEAKDITDWGRLEQIRKRIEHLERNRGK